MSDTFEVVGDDLVVTHGTSTERLSLVIPMDRVDLWIEMIDGSTQPVANYPKIRDQIMPEAAADYVRKVEAEDGVRAYAVATRWSDALRESLGKALLLPGYSENTEQPSQPTSGSDTASGSPTPSPQRRSRRSPTAS